MMTQIKTEHSHFVRAGEKRRVVYMCMFGHSEAFHDFQYEDAETGFVCFTDDPDLKSSNWNVVYLQETLTDPVRKAKRIKHMPSEHLLGYEQSLYVDNTMKIKSSIDSIFRLQSKTSAPLTTFCHPWRDCIYDEGEVLISGRIDDPATISRQLAFYRRLGHPTHAGLYASGMLLRQHGIPLLDRAMFEWHLQVVRYSFRDQISLPFIVRHLGLPVDLFPGKLTDNELVSWPFAPEDFRLPRDFDDQTYLDLHPDVEASGMNARKHYFQYGHSEGRRYR